MGRVEVVRRNDMPEPPETLLCFAGDTMTAVMETPESILDLMKE
jgi:hypothetical protein